MKVLLKTIILVGFFCNSFAQSTILEPNKVSISANYEFLDINDGLLKLRGKNNVFGPSIVFDNQQTGVKGFVGHFATPTLNNTFGVTSASSITFNTFQGGAYPSRMTILNNGNTGIGTEAPTTKLEVNGFTKLGSDAPAIKLKKITGVTVGTDNNCTTTVNLTGITDAKIIDYQVLIDWNTTDWIKEGYTYDPGQEFYAYHKDGTIKICLTNGNSYNILGKPIKVLITYEE